MRGSRCPSGRPAPVTLATVSENITVIDGTGDTIETWLHGAAGGIGAAGRFV